ncbi:hypothetical protein RhiirC2_772381 [Rhizophagus irregularis]|uniref:Uncharacterized protein n=1 Tax=Rhizophagus irregularis TaxID=588596 RepID=A0A2N1NRL7_9GLOM|nr:hypothetical protein RhiirC2_772381 [Rhizophagus irregularis]
MEFLIDQVSSKTGYNILKKEIFINHSFDEKHFYELRKKRKALFDLEDNIVTEKSISFKILEKVMLVTRPKFHRELNSVKDLNTLKTYGNVVRGKKRAPGITYNYVIT